MRLVSCATAGVLVLLASGCGGQDGTSAAPAAGYSASASISPGAVAPEAPVAPPPPTSSTTRLIGDGVALPSGVITFGTPADEAVAALSAALGEPTKDTGETDPFSTYGTCPGTTLRVLEYGGGALQLLFGDVESGTPVLHTWALTQTGDPASVPLARGLIGDLTTIELGVGTSVGDLQAEVGEESFVVSEDELSLDPAFELKDQSSGLRGFLTGTSATDTVTFVEAGAGCGE